MGGSGGGFWSQPRQLNKIRHDVELKNNESAFNSEVANIIDNALSEYNDRDVDVINKHLETLKSALSKDIEESIEMRFGGSVAKHSYVDGMSDIDILANVGKTELSSKSPEELLHYFKERIEDRLPNTKVEVGTMSVIVKYSDGNELQLLPSIKTATGIRVANSNGVGWSNVVKPHIFARKLTDVNNNNGGFVVPVIKLFKGNLIEYSFNNHHLI